LASTPVVPSSAITVSGADSGLEISGRGAAADSTVVEGAESVVASASELADSVSRLPSFWSSSTSVYSAPTPLSTFE